jgi:hypothetical protein
MNSTPPFNPPYMTVYDEGSGLRVVETLADGKTRTVSRDEISTSGPPATERGILTSEPKVKPGTKRATLFLEVPFAEKDHAKSAGARWDSQKRKWYVPHGLDINLFNRWWPDGMK